MHDEKQNEARFEFRTFGQHFDDVADSMRRFTEPVAEAFRERRSNEIYLVSPFANNHNIKIRNGKLDIKKLIQITDELEQWNPVAKADFPLDAAFLADRLFPALGADPAGLDLEHYSQKQLLRLVQMHPDLMAVRISKLRFGFTIHGTICEHAVVLVNGARVETVSCESTDTGLVKKTLRDLDLVGMENINYLKAIKRIIGMEPLPLANEEI